MQNEAYMRKPGLTAPDQQTKCPATIGSSVKGDLKHRQAKPLFGVGVALDMDTAFAVGKFGLHHTGAPPEQLDQQPEASVSFDSHSVYLYKY